ncbi:MAG: DinB family protein [Anaerolineae bacterium]|nr:DinB family protein [Anaerolineae bacterium]
MSEPTYTVEQALATLAETPPRIAALTDDLSPAQLHAPPQPEEWSLNEVLAHLRACADVWGGCIARIIAEDTPTFRAVSPRSYIHKTNYPTLDFFDLFRAFSAQRADLLATLERLPLESWSRVAMIKTVGKAYPRTVLNFADRMARHEREHLRQIEQIAAAVRE